MLDILRHYVEVCLHYRKTFTIKMASRTTRLHKSSNCKPRRKYLTPQILQCYSTVSVAGVL
uniref:Uncharacterized protein n=1 Tax=Anguilla anguilla TaxID=7936 RepID=A0A0E9QDQ7_ANGAN